MSTAYDHATFKDPKLYTLAACPVCGFNDHDDDVFNQHACKSAPKEFAHLRLSAKRALIVADLIDANNKTPGGVDVTPENVDEALSLLAAHAAKTGGD